jgi:hypothetical protein
MIEPGEFIAYYTLFIVWTTILIAHCTHALHSSFVERTVIMYDKMAAKHTSLQYRACWRPTEHNYK